MDRESGPPKPPQAADASEKVALCILQIAICNLGIIGAEPLVTWPPARGGRAPPPVLLPQASQPCVSPGEPCLRQYGQLREGLNAAKPAQYLRPACAHVRGRSEPFADESMARNRHR